VKYTKVKRSRGESYKGDTCNGAKMQRYKMKDAVVLRCRGTKMQRYKMKGANVQRYMMKLSKMKPKR
jgi:hypothetical protein